MRNIILLGFILLLIISHGLADQSQTDQENHPSPDAPVPIAFSIVGSSNPGINLFYNRTANLHISLFSGNVKSVQGLQVGGISNFVRSDFSGYDATGIYSRVGGDFSGAQVSGVIAQVEGDFYGLQEAGIFGYAGGNFFGLQSSGIANKVDGDFTGLQVSGIKNQANNVKVLQIAGVLNESNDVHGVQISGVVNKAKHVRGVQIGLINKSETLDGIAIGLVNLSETGSVNLVSWGSPSGTIHAGIKFAPNNYWFTILTLGNTQGLEEDQILKVFQGRMGFHFDIVPRLYVEIDLGGGNSFSNNLSEWNDESSYQSVIEARVSAGYKIGSRLSVFGGVSNTKIGEDLSWLHQDSGELRPFFGIQI